MFPVWRGRDPAYKEQVANACDSFVVLTPASETPAAAVTAAWADLLPGQDIPLLWERTTDDCLPEDCGC